MNTNSQRIFIGIDPGYQGGIASLEERGTWTYVCNVPLLPKKAREKPQYDVENMYEIARTLTVGFSPTIVIETPIAMPRQDCMALARQFTGYGLWLGIFAAFPVLKVSPVAWKKAMHVGSDKAQSIAMAADLFKNIPLAGGADAVSGRCEALLLAEYGRRLG